MGNYSEGEITFFTVPDTGIKLPIRKVSPKLAQELEKALRREMPEPEPPQQEVVYGDRVVLERNPAHPDYLAQLDSWKARYQEELMERTTRLLVQRGIAPFLQWDEECQKQVDELREEMRRDFGVELDKNDRYVWVMEIALGTAEDLTDLTTHLMRRSTVTEGAVADSLKKF
jgi:hypothetical protein